MLERLFSEPLRTIPGNEANPVPPVVEAKVDPGGKVPVKISYSPPAGGPLSLWNEIVLQATLRGGTPVAASGAVNVALRLRGFVPAQL